MGDLGELVVSISADMSGLQQGLAQAQSAVSNFADQANDGATKIQQSIGNGLKTAGQNLTAFGASLRSTARELSQLSGVFAVAGAAGIAPFVLAIHDSSASIVAVGQAMQKLTDVGQVFYEHLASDVVPILNDLAKSLNGALQWFLALPEPLRQSIEQGVLLGSVFSLMTAGALKFADEVVRLVENVSKLAGNFMQWIGVMISTNPVMLAVGAGVVALIALMIKYQNVANAVMNTFELLFRSLKSGFDTVAGSIETTLAIIYNALAKVYDLLAKIPGPTQAFFANMANGAKNLSDTLRDLAQGSFNDVGVQAQKMGQILTTGTGEWALGFNTLKNTAVSFFTAFKNGSDQFIQSHKTMQSVMSGTVSALGTLSTALQGAAADNKSFAGIAKVVAIGMAIVNTATGVTKALADYPWPASLGIASIIGAAGAVQISTIAAQGFATGTDSVPAMLSPGEMVVPNTFAGAIRQGDLTLGGPSSGQNIPSGDPGINITIYAEIANNIDISQLTKEIAYETQKQLRYVRNRR